MRRFFAVVIVAVLALTLCACDFDESNNSFRGGELLDNEKMSELKEQFVTVDTDSGTIDPETDESESSDESEVDSGETESEGGATEEYSDMNTDVPTEKDNGTEVTEERSEVVSETVSVTETEADSYDESATVYWTKSGSVWHTTDKCHHLKKSKSIESGSVEEAIEAGKSKVCSSCGK